jgi:cell fate (sporulation/competence/biofilm development) regulator YlbF (YheA/YmcA/DUF963 family)
MTQKISAVAIQSLKEALCTIYWYKSDLKSFLFNSLGDKSILSSVNWEIYKRQIVSDIIYILTTDQDKYLGDLRRLFHEVCKMENFRHLLDLEDGIKKAERAKTAVNDLRKIVETHDKATRTVEELEERRKKEVEKLSKSLAVRQKLEELRNSFNALVSSTPPHKRGFDLEKLLYDLFELFDLDPKASFRNTGEQIDGGFSLEGTDYLFEGKWQTRLSDIQDLDAFASKVHRKLDNTLGLFLSVNGFSADGVTAHSTGRPVIILMTGVDLMAVLEERIDFVSLLLRKRRHAAQTGNILLQASDIFQSG